MTTPVSPVTAAKRPSVWEDFIDIFASPSEVFARRENNGFGIALLVLTSILTALYFGTRSLLQPVFDGEFSRNTARMMRENPQLTAEQMEMGRKFTEGVFGGLFVALGVPLIVCLLALVMWVAGKPFDSKQTLRSGFVVATYSYFPRIIEAIVNAIQGLLLDADSMTSLQSIKLGPTRFMDVDTTSPVVIALLSRVDVFTLWVTALIVIGLRVTGKMTTSQAAIAGAIVWLCGAIPALFGALRM
ncbi:MAG: YIP1 family protein [Anaerolineae bacterium]|nr:YIP1 family protein [Gemmatimonadaceae bacterium]